MPDEVDAQKLEEAFEQFITTNRSINDLKEQLNEYINDSDDEECCEEYDERCDEEYCNNDNDEVSLQAFYEKYKS